MLEFLIVMLCLSKRQNAVIKRSYIFSLYALNISSEGRYAYLWPDHVVARLDGAQTRFFRPRISFADAFAANGCQMLFLTWDFTSNRRKRTVTLDWLDPPPQPNSSKMRKMWRAVLDRRIERDQLMCREDRMYIVDKGI